MKIVLASKNRHKLEEIRQITDRFGMELVLQSEIMKSYSGSFGLPVLNAL